MDVRETTESSHPAGQGQCRNSKAKDGRQEYNGMNREGKGSATANRSRKMLPFYTHYEHDMSLQGREPDDQQASREANEAAA